MKLCVYCQKPVYTEHYGAAYMIDETTEDLYWVHMECVEIFEGVVLSDNRSRLR